MVLGRPVARRLREAAKIEPGRPALRVGLRSAIAVIVPLLLGWILGDASFTWAALVALFVSIADKGGPYWVRFKFSVSLALAASLAFLAGAACGVSSVSAVLGMFLVGAGAGLAATLGDRGIATGRFAAISFALSLAVPIFLPGEGLVRAGYGLLGGAWAMALSLALWPLRFFRVARTSVAIFFRALAARADELAALLEEGASEARWGRHLRYFERHLRERADEARDALIATRRGALGMRRRGEGLLALFELAQRSVAILEGLTAVLEPLGARPESEELRQAATSRLRSFASDARVLAQGALGVSVGGVSLSYGLGPTLAAERVGHATSILFDRLAEYVRAGWLEVVGLSEGRLPVHAGFRDPSALRLMADQVRARSQIFRHAMRLAFVSALSVAVTRALRLQMPQWVTVAVIGILAPYSTATVLRGVQRVAGTVLGGIVAAVLAATIKHPLGIFLLIFVFTSVGVSFLPLNYGAYSMLQTPTYVLLSEMGTGDWHLAETRVVNTLLGGALALLGTRFLWPGAEWKALAGEVSRGLRACGEYLVEVSRGAPISRIRACRRSAGAAAAGAEAAFQRVLDQGEAGSKEAGSLLAVVTYLRRLDSSITSLSSVRRRHPFPVEIAEPCRRVLEGLADSMEKRRAPAPMGDLSTSRPENPLAELLEHRVVRRISVLHREISGLGRQDERTAEEGGRSTS